jgi:hypothetical protein
MTFLSLVLSTVMCTITWFNPDKTVHTEGKPLWPEDVVWAVAQSEQKLVPNLTFEVTCEKQ